MSKRYESEPERRKVLRASTKKCTRCGEFKSGADFTIYRSSDGYLYLISRCKPCMVIVGAEYKKINTSYAEAHAEGQKGNKRAWAAKHIHTTLETATNNNKEWTGPEMEIILREDLTVAEMAKMLGRTYYSVTGMRRQCRRDPRKQVLAGVERGEL